MAVVRDFTNAGATRAKGVNANGPADTFRSLHVVNADGVLTRKVNLTETVEETLGDGRRRAPILEGPLSLTPGETYLIKIDGQTYLAYVDHNGDQQLVLGDAGGSSLQFQAGQPLPAYRAVYQGLDELIYLASASVVEQATNALYITRAEYSIGDTASVAGVGGMINEPFAAWPAGRRLYLQENGLLLPTPPATGVVVVVAMALSQTKIQVVNQLAVVQA